MDYKSAGVDVEKADRLVDWLIATQNAQGPWADSVLGGVGGFAALFRVPHIAHIKKPLLVSSTDGVGTKVRLAAQYRRLSGIGQDLVAMCVNDILCCGATPLFFLDYYAVGRLDEALAKEFLQSVRSACQQAKVALIGGETAEMPGVYHSTDFDCAGFVVGVVDEEHLLGATRVQTGDVAVGISSTGFHSNGYSLLREVFAKDTDAWIEQLLTPTALYTVFCEQLRTKGLSVHALAHITGGGFENVPRVLPKGTALKLQDWLWPEPFLEVQKRTQMSREKMLRTLNCGIGFVVILPKNEVDRVCELANNSGFNAVSIGAVVPSEAVDDEPRVLY